MPFLVSHGDSSKGCQGGTQPLGASARATEAEGYCTTTNFQPVTNDHGPGAFDMPLTVTNRPHSKSDPLSPATTGQPPKQPASVRYLLCQLCPSATDAQVIGNSAYTQCLVNTSHRRRRPVSGPLAAAGLPLRTLLVFDHQVQPTPRSGPSP